jgi:hypothetical protein
MSSQDGQRRTIAVIGVAPRVHYGQSTANGGTVPGVGREAYIVDPTGVLVGPHETNRSA